MRITSCFRKDDAFIGLGHGLRISYLISVLLCFPLSPRTVSAAETVSDPIDMARRYAQTRHEIMRAIAEETGTTIPQGYERIMESIREGDWPTTAGLWKRHSDRDREEQYALWQPMLEAFGYLEQADRWPGELLTRYADEILSSIPDGSIYFGGTDPGRFIISAHQNMTDSPDIFVITQNALADNTYLDYMRNRHGHRIHLPSKEDANRAFQQYVEDVREGRIPAGAEVAVKDGRVSVQGIAGVMMINGILARMIFEENKDRHEFYVEESYVIEWMLPHLEPHGLIMRLHSEPINFTPAIVKRDFDFWEARAQELIDDPLFIDSEAARRTYSKLRSAIAGLYAHRRMFDDAEQAFRQAIDLYPESPEASFRLADLFLNQRRYMEALSTMEALHTLDPANTRVQSYLTQIRDMERKDGRRQALEDQSAAGDLGLEDRLELAHLYQRLQKADAFEKHIRTMLKDNDLPPSAYLQIGEMCVDSHRLDLVAMALERYLEREPNNEDIWIDLAATLTSLNQPDEALHAVGRAIDVAGEKAVETIRTDARLNPMRHRTDFQALLIQPTQTHD